MDTGKYTPIQLETFSMVIVHICLTRDILGYYNKAIAASPVHALPGYIIGGLSWFAIPWLCATTMGLSALALEGSPSFPTYPNRMDPADVTAGLVLPYAAVGLLGRPGAICTLIMIFSTSLF